MCLSNIYLHRNYTQTHTCTDMYMYLQTHTIKMHIHAESHLLQHADRHRDTHAYIIHTYPYAHTYILHTYTNTNTHGCRHTHKHNAYREQIHTYKHTHMSPYMHTHTQMQTYTDAGRHTS